MLHILISHNFRLFSKKLYFSVSVSTMTRIGIFLMLFMLISCEYFNVKKTSSEAILEEELQSFKWNEVDEYPAFSTCDANASKEDRKRCFETTLAYSIVNRIQKENITVTQDIEDTIMIKFEISESGQLTLLNIKTDSLTIQQIPNIENLLVRSLDSLPKIYPAIKRSQQVKTEFTLPVIISVK